MGKLLMSARGSLVLPDVVELYEDRVVIRHPVGPATELLLGEITSVDIERLGLFGHLLFGVRGHAFLPGTVRYERRFERGMVELKNAIQSQIAAAGAPAEKPRDNTAASIAEIQKWADLKEKGLITPEEYELKRRQILFGSDSLPKEKEIVKEIVKLPCKYCGTLVEVTAAKCDSCGAPLK